MTTKVTTRLAAKKADTNAHQLMAWRAADWDNWPMPVGKRTSRRTRRPELVWIWEEIRDWFISTGRWDEVTDKRVSRCRKLEPLPETIEWASTMGYNLDR